MKQTIGTVHGLSSGRGGTRPRLGFALCRLAPGSPPPPPPLSQVGVVSGKLSISEVCHGDLT